MKNTVRWLSDRLDGAVVGSFLGTPWSNEIDAHARHAQPPEGDNTRNLLFTKKLSNRKNKVFDVKFLVKTFGMNKKDHRMAVNAGQTLNHGLLAARHSIAGQGFSNGCLQGYNRSQ